MLVHLHCYRLPVNQYVYNMSMTEIDKSYSRNTVNMSYMSCKGEKKEKLYLSSLARR